MQIMENVYLAISGLLANKMRALLTMLGIIIGIGSVISIVTVGNALTSSITGEMSSVGATNIQVFLIDKDSEYNFSGPPQSSANRTTMKESDLITDEMIEAYQKIYKNEIEAITIFKSLGNGKVEDGRRYANVNIFTSNEGLTKSTDLEILKGRFLTKDDIGASRNVAVVSDKLVKNMFKPKDNPLGKEIKLTYGDKIQAFKIIGVYKYVESNFEAKVANEKDIVSALYLPLSSYKSLADNVVDGYSNIIVMGNPNLDVKKVSTNTKNFFNRYYKNNTKYKIDTLEMESMIETVSNVLNTLSIAIAVIAGISLLVGGIGVMNIMLVSVTERTREIGTRKALGAKNQDILAQFIVESVIICIIGGFIGIGVGYLGGSFGSNLLGYPPVVSYESIIIAVTFSTFIGVFFGYYPAKKAASLDPIEALRYE